MWPTLIDFEAPQMQSCRGQQRVALWIELTEELGAQIVPSRPLFMVWRHQNNPFAPAPRQQKRL